MPKKFCPKCKKIAEKVNRVFSIVATWDEEEDDYRYGHKEEYEAEVIDKCVDCGEELEEIQHIPTLPGGYGIPPDVCAGGWGV